MKKIIKINGMSCAHCSARVEKALNSIAGVTAKVDLVKKQAVADIKDPVSDDDLRNAVVNAGYEVVEITEKKGLFGK